MSEEYYCPHCKNKIDTFELWGTTSYYCIECNKLISGDDILKEGE